MKKSNVVTGLELILFNVYGVGPVSAPPEAIVWAMSHLEDTAKARKDLKIINDIREKHGAMRVSLPYGHKHF